MPEEKNSAQSSNTLMAVLCYLGILVLVPLLTEYKKDEFVNFHIRQGLGLLILSVISYFIMPIPFIGWILSVIIFVLFIIGLINAATGKKGLLPIIGPIADKIKI